VIRKKDDLSGLLIRVGGPVDKAIVEALKGIPEFMHMPDTYLALSKGVLDVHMSPFGPMKGLRTAEVTSFHTENANLHMSVFGAIMNLDKWNALPREDRQAIEELSGPKAAELFGGVFEKLDEDAITFMKEKGDTFLLFSEKEKLEWRELLDVIVADWVKKQEKRGRPAQQILDSTLRFRDKHLSQYSRKAELKSSMISFFYHKQANRHQR
jgi:TRAP-type C4-dicarboxylate transport system substrate-binding protein